MPWYTQYGITYKEMAYQQSCFPCCLHIALYNLGKVRMEDAIEDRWNELQLAAHPNQGLATNAPDALDIIRNIPQTAFATTAMKLITPEMMNAATSETKALDLVAGFVNGTYKAMVLGLAHANVFLRSGTDYVQVKVSPDINPDYVERSAGLNVGVLTAPNGDKAIEVKSGFNADFNHLGNFVLLL